MKNSHILITGGAGYIGSHMVRLLLENGLKPVVFDNLSTGKRQFVPRGVPLIQGDLRSWADVQKPFKKYKIQAVIHFAALIVVPESVAEPLQYFENNVSGTCQLLKAMGEAGVRDIIFSSSACVYGAPKRVPIEESAPFQIENPYGSTKVMAEQILSDMAGAGQVRYIALRYFNVAGAHPSGEIGISLKKPTHLIPNVMRAASGRQKELTVFGKNYETPDGTPVRDYVHVLDLCEAHLAALRALRRGTAVNEAINVGNGKGFTVLQVMRMAEKVTGRPVPFKFAPRRPGDCPKVVASFRKAKKLLGWEPKRGLEEILESAWMWEQRLGQGVLA